MTFNLNDIERNKSLWRTIEPYPKKNQKITTKILIYNGFTVRLKEPKKPQLVGKGWISNWLHLKNKLLKTWDTREAASDILKRRTRTPRYNCNTVKLNNSRNTQLYKRSKSGMNKMIYLRSDFLKLMKIKF